MTSQLAMSTAYLWAAVTMVVLFLVAVLIANMILFKPGNPGTTKRRVWFWVLCILTGVVSFVINYIIAGSCTVPTIKADYLMHAGIAAGVGCVLFVIIGFAVSKMFSNSKVGTWF